MRRSPLHKCSRKDLHMNNNITIFENNQFGAIRTVLIKDEAWFVAKDVCDALEIKNTTQAVAALDDDERSMFNIGRQGETNIINKSGLYNLVIASRKPEAKFFKRWLTHEVIPSIEKHGLYATPETAEKILNDPDIMIGILKGYKEEKEKRITAERTIEEQKPKVLFADSVSGSQSSILIGDLAKLIAQNGIDIGQNRLFEWLRVNGYLMNRLVLGVKTHNWKWPLS